MQLRDGGIDLFYIDESEFHPLSVVSAVRVPFLRNIDGNWIFVWQDYHDKAIEWRKKLSAIHNIRARAEIHTSQILSHSGLYLKGHKNLRPDQATNLVKSALGTIDFLPDQSVITAFATDKSQLMGYHGVKAALMALFQRIRRQCGNDRNGLIFFDDGRPEYIHLYRKATKYLPTGSKVGGWGQNRSSNLPLDMFPKDANLKASDKSLFLQIADLVVVSARLKLQHERGLLPAKRERRGHAVLYESVPTSRINLAATSKRTDGIVPIL